MACPFFLPGEKLAGAGWLHPDRLPLGAGWSGVCTAPGHAGAIPSPDELRDFCNLGYPSLGYPSLGNPNLGNPAACPRVPAERAWDSIRFGAKLRRSADGKVVESVQVRYVCERDHRPAQSGWLGYDTASGSWRQTHPDPRLQRMAECFLEVWLEKKLPKISLAAS